MNFHNLHTWANKTHMLYLSMPYNAILHLTCGLSLWKAIYLVLTLTWWLHLCCILSKDSFKHDLMMSLSLFVYAFAFRPASQNTFAGYFFLSAGLVTVHFLWIFKKGFVYETFLSAPEDVVGSIFAAAGVFKIHFSSLRKCAAVE